MRYIGPPDLNELPTLRRVLESIRPDLRTVVGPVRGRIERAYGRFDAATPTTLHELNPLKFTKEIKEALGRIFSQRLGEFDDVWEGLSDQFAQAGGSTCPYCNFGEQWEHDHYLPRSVFPEFTLYPKNLVPICKPCNSKKLKQYTSDDGRLFLHLYSELSGAGNLLRVSVQYHPRPRVSYTLVNVGLQAEEFGVLKAHFGKLGLERRYAKQAAGTLGLLIKEFRSTQNLSMGRQRLRRRLNRMVQDRAIQCPRNHWEVALLENIAADAAFTNYIFS